MAQLTVKSLATTVHASVEQLLEKFAEVGLPQTSPEDVVSYEEKIRLLEYLYKDSKRGRPQTKKKIVSSLKADKANTPGVVVEVRKTRVYKTATSPAEPTASEETSRSQSPSPSLTPEQDAGQQAKPKTSSKKSPRTPKEPALASSKKPTEEVVAAKASAQEVATVDTEAKRVQPSKKKRAKDSAKQDAATEEPMAKDKQVVPLSTPDINLPQEKAKRAKKGRHAQKALFNNERSSMPNREKEQRKKLHVQSDKSGKRKFVKKKHSTKRIVQVHKHEFERPTEPVRREVAVYENISVKELAQGMAIKGAELVKRMLELGMQVAINQTLDQDSAILVVEELGHVAKIKQVETAADDIKELIEDGKDIQPCAPVVTIMGHVDHGKTSLLDYIRQSAVADSEAGSITQHIGAYQVQHQDSKITFLDTPGHAAFTAMRAYGARLTDIIVLLVAADDGVMPQTEESIEHAQAADVPVIVAINKIDKPDTDVEKIKSELAKRNIVPEDWGGKNIFVEISAKTGQGIDQLLEAILLQAEILELKAAVDGTAHGLIVEAALDRGRGVMVTVLVQSGQLKKGDMILAGSSWGKVRSLMNEHNQNIVSVGPASPVVVFGLTSVPAVAEKFFVVRDERKGRKIAEYRQHLKREQANTKSLISADNFLSQLQTDQAMVRVLIKADVHGSVEALKKAITDLSTDAVKCEIIGTGVGGINESDVYMALTSKAMIISFNVRADTRANKLIQSNRDLIVRYYSIIYEAIDDVKQMMEGLVEPEIHETIIGLAEVKDIFRSSKYGTVAGSLVVNGIVKRGNPIRVLRDNVVIYEGELESLRRFKDEAKEVINGTECGIAVKNYNDVKVGDQIEVYERVEEPQQL